MGKVVMTYQDRLIAFIKLKDKFIFKETKIHYINKKDIDDIKTWSERNCTVVYSILDRNIRLEDAHLLADNTCIWCIQFNLKNEMDEDDECPGCSYGKNHGYCDSTIQVDTLYNKLFKTGVKSKLTNDLYKSWISAIEEKAK